jgi:pyruvate formate lyase activating enzyme
MLDTPPTPPATLVRARQIALDNGLRYVYTGNIHNPAGEATRCHGCGEVVIGRDWYEVVTWHLTDDGRCTFCGEVCAGIFDGPPGTWGRRRQPVRLAGR